jgi:hypothetical protein
MVTGKQLTMEKKMYEKDIMRKALLNDLNEKFRNLEYCQNVIESNWQIYSDHKELYKKVGQLLADSKFYYLSATFVLMKDIPEFSKLRLDEHMRANRPPDLHNVTPRSIFMTFDLLNQTKDQMLEAIMAYRNYLKPKFREYYGECVQKIKESLKELDKHYVV